jgi:hypothetical protein
MEGCKHNEMLAVHPFCASNCRVSRSSNTTHTVESESLYGFFVLLLSATIKPVKIESTATRESSNRTPRGGLKIADQH